MTISYRSESAKFAFLGIGGITSARPSLKKRQPATLDAFAGGGEMGARIRAYDWAKTPIGPMESWPQSLKTALSICLGSSYPMFVWWNCDHRIIFYNDAYIPVPGGKHPRQLGSKANSPEGWADVWDRLGPEADQVFYEGKATWNDSTLLTMNRSGFWEECYFTWSYSPIRDESGGVGGIFCACQEVTDQVLIERRLKILSELGAIKERTLQAAGKQSIEALRANPSDLPFVLFYSLNSNQAQASLVSSTGVLPGTQMSPEELEVSQNSSWPLKEVIETRKPLKVDGLRARFSGELPHCLRKVLPDSAYLIPVESPGQDHPSNILILGISPNLRFNESYERFFSLLATRVSTNLAEAQAVEAERKRAEQLAEIDRAKTAFFSNVSHEFRTPLTLMLGPLEDNLADSTALTQAHREREELAYRNALRLLKLVNSLLDFSRIEAGRMKAFFRPVDLAHLTADLASVFRSAIEKAGLKFTVNVASIGQAVYVNREMWEKIVLNLLSNALKFTLQGEIIVSLKRIGDHVALSVRDTGIGIPEQELPRVFERFHRVEGSQGRSHEGTGIGLALIQELARIHGGTIHVDSKLRKGSLFTVEIPLGKMHLPPDQLGQEEAQTSIGGLGIAFVEEALRWLPNEEGVANTATGPNPGLRTGHDLSSLQSASVALNLGGRKARILLADDNADMRRYVQGLLSKSWEVEAVADGKAALVAAKTNPNPPDLILSDVMMPKMNGFELLHALKSDPATKAIPVILLSARAGEEATIEGLQAGADDYLTKPFSAKELLARVNTQLKVGQLRQEAIVLQAQTEKARQELYEFFIQAPAPMVVLLGPEHRFFLANPPYERFVGGRKVTGKTVLEAFTQKEVGSFVERLDEVYRTGVPYTGQELPLSLPDENGVLQHRFVNVGYHPFRKHDGTIKGILAVHQDVTEQVIARKKVEKLASDLRSSVQARDEFLSIASHELKTPITSIKLQLQMTRRRIKPELNQAPTPERLAAVVETSLKQTERLTQLIEDLLDVSRIQAGKLFFNFQEVEVTPLIQEVVDRYSDHLVAAQCPIQVKVTPNDLKAHWDRSRIEQVIVNLVSNAIKYAPGQPIHIRAQTQGDSVVISVQDFGPGIRKELQPRIFERFERATSSRNISGLGLGLYIVKQIVAGHQGTIRVESTEGKGTTFIIELPIFPPKLKEQSLQGKTQGENQ